MHNATRTATATRGLDLRVTHSAADRGMAKLTVLHRERVAALPEGVGTEIRVLHARLDPGDRTPRHSHRHPVTVWMQSGTFTLDLDDRSQPVTVRAGEVFVEPASVAMTGSNRDPAQAAEMILFYACEGDVPFADPL